MNTFLGHGVESRTSNSRPKKQPLESKLPINFELHAVQHWFNNSEQKGLKLDNNLWAVNRVGLTLADFNVVWSSRL